jgi:hypothetical protein
MQSALEHEIELLLVNLRSWLRQRDRAVLIGTLLCCVPFLPVTFVGLVITLFNLVLLWAGKLKRAELPLLLFAVFMTALYVLLWWLLFTFLINSRSWPSIGWIWQWLQFIVPTRPHWPFQDI